MRRQSLFLIFYCPFNALAKCNTEVEIIPAGYTSKLQPMDVGVNKPFKDRMRNSFIGWIIEIKRQQNTKERPRRTIVSEWIDTSWNHLHKNIFVNAFYGSGFAVRELLHVPVPAPELEINVDDDDEENNGDDEKEDDDEDDDDEEDDDNDGDGYGNDDDIDNNNEDNRHESVDVLGLV